MDEQRWPPEWVGRAAARISRSERTTDLDAPRAEADEQPQPLEDEPWRPPEDQPSEPPEEVGASATVGRGAGWPFGRQPRHMHAAAEEMAAADQRLDEEYQGRAMPAPPHRLWRRRAIWMCTIYALVCLGGVYADMRFLSQFEVDYLSYAGPTDLLTGFVSFLRVAATPSFVIAFAILAALLIVLMTGFRYAFTMVRALAQSASLGKALTPARDAIRETFLARFDDEGGFWRNMHAIIKRPYPALVIATIASFVGINVSVVAATRDLAEFTEDFKNDPGSENAFYEVVSVSGADPIATWNEVVRLRTTGNFAFYYDLGADQAVVLPRNSISDVAADPVPLEPSGQEAMEAGSMSLEPSKIAAGADEQLESVVVANATTTSSSDQIGGASPSIADASAGSSGLEPAARQTIAAETKQDSAALRGVTVAQASTAVGDAVEGQLMLQPGLAPSQPADRSAAPGTTAADDLTAIGGNVVRSRGSLDGMKTYLEQVEDGFVKIREFVNDLDSALGAIDQAFTDLEKHLADSGKVVAYADCPELPLSQPIRFAPQGAGLSLESVGLLFQARQEFRTDRSGEREGWLVIEAYAEEDLAAPAGGEPLAIQRGEAVRSFLHTELGLPADALKVVASSAASPQAAHVRIFDCLKRGPETAPSAPPRVTELPLMRSASASEIEAVEPLQPVAFEAAGQASDQLALLSDGNVTAREGPNGLLFTVPGHLLFGTDSARIEPPARRALDEIGATLARNPDREAVVIGHSDSFGDARYNLTLSERRARQVQSYLLAQFDLAPARLRVEGRGEQDPIASNDTYDGRLANRRIEVLLLN